MKYQKPIIIGGGVALILWLLTRESDGAAEESVRVEEIADAASGTIVTTVKGGDGLQLVDVGFTIEDEDTGGCIDASDAFGGDISCAEHDKRLLAAQSIGGIGSEANG
jgi:hypothetical protein